MSSRSQKQIEDKRNAVTEESYNTSQDQVWVTAAYTQTLEIILSKSTKPDELESLPIQCLSKAGKWRAIHGPQKGAAATGTLLP